jgi:energy-coupling factor transport system substrate-specific component
MNSIGSMLKPRGVRLFTLRNMTLMACLSTLSIVGRIYMSAIPNVQPSTVIIICAALVYGVRFGLIVAFLTVFGSNLVLGFGPFIVMQLIAWGSIAIISGTFGRFYEKIPPIIISVYSGLTGLFFGFMVSLNVLFIGGPAAFWVYYLRGIPMDLYHAAGNFLFYLTLGPVIVKMLQKYKDKTFYEKPVDLVDNK